MTDLEVSDNLFFNTILFAKETCLLVYCFNPPMLAIVYRLVSLCSEKARYIRVSHIC